MLLAESSVKHWQETERLLDRLLRPGSPQRAALAVVVRIEGSAYRRPGAKLLIEEKGTGLGGVSGGCLEEDVRQVGREVLRSGQPQLRHYDTSTDETKLWGLGLGCNGRVDVFVQPVATDREREVWSRVKERLHGDASFAIVTLIDGPGAPGVQLVDAAGGVTGTLGDPDLDREAQGLARSALLARGSRVRALGSRQLFIEVLLPPPRLLICGAGDDAMPLAAYAAGVGFRVLVADHRAAYLSEERFPEARARFLRRPEEDLGDLPKGAETYAVVMTHSLEHDREWARRLLATDIPYVGLLGPRARTEKILSDVGLAILAEVLAVWSEREPVHLREKEATVHA